MLRKCSICTLTLFIVQLRFCCSCCSTHIITVTGALRFDIVLLSHAVNSSRYPVHSSRVVSNVGAPNMIQCLMILPNYPRQLRSSAAHVWSSIAPYSIVYSCIFIRFTSVHLWLFCANSTFHFDTDGTNDTHDTQIQIVWACDQTPRIGFWVRSSIAPYSLAYSQRSKPCSKLARSLRRKWTVFILRVRNPFTKLICLAQHPHNDMVCLQLYLVATAALVL